MSLFENNISKINVFESTYLNNLQILALNHNKITDISPFSRSRYGTFNKLIELWLDHNNISSLATLNNAKFTNIQKIRLQNNNISDISIISQLNFNSLREIDLSHNVISSIQSLYIRKGSLKILNLSDNSFVIDLHKQVLETLKENKINVIL